MSEFPGLKPIRVDKYEKGQHIVYASKCSMGLGITLLVFGVLFVILGIAEVSIAHFPSAGAIFGVPGVLITAGVYGVLAGKYVFFSYIRGVIIHGTISAIVCGLGFVAQIARIIIVIILIPLNDSEGPSNYYYYDHSYFPNGTIEEYDNDPRIVPRVTSSEDMDFVATPTIFVLEFFLLLVAFIIAIIEAACGCRSACCGVKVMPKMMIQQPDGTLTEATVVYNSNPPQAQANVSYPPQAQANVSYGQPPQATEK